MARPPRIEYAGAVYHVMARGNHGQSLFADDQDRRRFLETVGEGCGKTGWRIHAVVLMSNHYHLLVETPEGRHLCGNMPRKSPSSVGATSPQMSLLRSWGIETVGYSRPVPSGRPCSDLQQTESLF
jgi:REP element-mobilizing transposase RayT